MVKTYLVGKSMAVLLHNQKLVWKVPILLQTEQIECRLLQRTVVKWIDGHYFDIWGWVYEQLFLAFENSRFVKLYLYFIWPTGPSTTISQTTFAFNR